MQALVHPDDRMMSSVSDNHGRSSRSAPRKNSGGDVDMAEAGATAESHTSVDQASVPSLPISGESSVTLQKHRLNIYQAEMKTTEHTESDVAMIREQMDKTVIHPTEQESVTNIPNQNQEVLGLRQEVSNLRKRWKQAAGELNRVLAQNQGFSQITDQELIQRATQLRFNVRNLAVQGFGDGVVSVESFRPFEDEFQQVWRVPHDLFVAWMKSSGLRPLIVGLFLWTNLKLDIFGRFCWAGTNISKVMTCLTQTLQPVRDDVSVSSSEQTRKFQMWRANTANLLSEADTQQDEDHGGHRRPNEKMVQTLCTWLYPFSASRERDLADQLRRIVNEAFDLDKIISKQVPEIVWYNASFGRKISQFFDPETMELKHGKQFVNDDRRTWLPLSPGLIRRGNSRGEEFELENLLLKSEVACL